MKKKVLHNHTVSAAPESGATDIAQNEGKFLRCFFYILCKFATLLYLGLIVITVAKSFDCLTFFLLLTAVDGHTIPAVPFHFQRVTQTLLIIASVL